MKNKKTKTFEEKKHHTSQGSERPPLVASDAVPAARLALLLRNLPLQLGSAVRHLPLAANFSLMAAAAAASRTRRPGPRPGLQLRQATPSSRATLLRPVAPPSRCTLLRSASPLDPAPAPPLTASVARSRRELLLCPELAPVCSARARRLQLEEDKRRRGKRIR